MYTFKKDQLCKFARFQCPECSKIVIGNPKEFIGNFEDYINRTDEMLFANEYDCCINDRGISYSGLCPNCGEHIHVNNVRYLWIDFTKF